MEASQQRILKCQNCGAAVEPGDLHCEQCGAKLLFRRVLFGVPKAEDFKLTSELAEGEAEERSDSERWDFPPKQGEERPAAGGLIDDAAATVRYAGFFRRAAAFGIDLGAIALLSAIMGAMAYVGYKVGIAAHGRFVGADNIAALVAILLFGALGLSSVYFIALHGQGGQTVGKWLLGLRVVGAERRPIGYRQAARRWFATLGFAPVALGLLWALWQRDKRTWHDLVARTWVERE